MTPLKNKLIFFGVALLVLLSSGIFTCLDRMTGNVRYHQHLEQPGEAELSAREPRGGEGLCTHLPIIRVDTGGKMIPGDAIINEEGLITGARTGENGETEILISLSTIEGEGVWHREGDEAALSSQALFHIRGNSSRAFSKHSYRIKLVEDANPEQNRDLPLLGMTANADWALHGPFLDKTQLRNYMWMNISAEVMGYAPNVRFCELILNGEYQGLYLLMETVSMDSGRVELTDYREGDPVCSYILQMGSRRRPERTIDNFTFYTNRMEEGKQVEVVYPGLLSQTEQVKNYVRGDFSEIERMLYSNSMLDGSREYTRYLDVSSFVDYYILQEFLAVNDAFSNSTFFYRDVRGKLCIGPVWDYNNVLNNFFTDIPAEGFILSQRGWYSRLMMDEAFVERVISRYRQLRRGALSDEYLLNYIDETIDWLGEAIDRNYEVWGYSFDASQLGLGERRNPPVSEYSHSEKSRDELVAELNPASVEEAVAWMKDYLLRRGAWLDAHIDALLQYCRSSKNALRIIE